MEIHRKLASLCEEYNPNWLAMQNVICIVGNSELRPDVGAWFQQPTFAQLSKPIVHSCPPPNLWIEVILLIISCLKKVCNGWILSEFPQLFFDEDPDCSNAIEKITFGSAILYWHRICWNSHTRCMRAFSPKPKSWSIYNSCNQPRYGTL